MKKILFISLILLLFSTYSFAITQTFPLPDGNFSNGFTGWNKVETKTFSGSQAGSQNVWWFAYCSGSPCNTRRAFDFNSVVVDANQNAVIDFNITTNFAAGWGQGHANFWVDGNVLQFGDTIDFDLKFDDIVSSTGNDDIYLFFWGTDSTNSNSYTTSGSSCTTGGYSVNGVYAAVSILNTDNGSLLNDTSWHHYSFALDDCPSIDFSKPVRFSFSEGMVNFPQTIPLNTQFRVDNFTYTRESFVQLQTEITEPNQQPLQINNDYTIKFRVFDVAQQDFISDANVRFSFANSPFGAVAFNSSTGFYEATINSSTVGDINYAVDVNKVGGYIADYDEGTISFAHPEFQYIAFTPIQNIASYTYSSIDITPSDESKQIIFKVDSNSSSTENPTFNIFNTLKDGKQYFIYTSSTGDSNSWAFNDTLTFGSTNFNPMQKIWNQVNDRYTHSFTDTLSAMETKYYKLTYKNPYAHYFSIKDDANWYTNLVPQIISDFNGIDYDSYSISAFSNMRSVFVNAIPQLTGDDTNAYELQVTAWADTNNIQLLGGITVNGTDTTTTANLTTQPHRYSFPASVINSDDRDITKILLKTNSNSSTNVYISDYALVPRAYFTQRLSLLKGNGDLLDLFLLNGFSNKYIQEGKPFKINTQAYDREGVLERVELIAYFSSVSVSNQVSKEIQAIYNFDDNLDHSETIVNFSHTFDGITDLNGNAQNFPTRDLFVQANLYDDENFHVAVQTNLIKFVQYPYFPSDVELIFFPTEKRKGKKPSGFLTFKLSDASTVEGLDIRVYSDTNTINNPNFRTTLYKDKDFSCVANDCSMNLTIDEYLFEDVNQTTLSFIALLNTEYESLTNYLTRTDRTVFITPIEFTQARIHEVLHRIDRKYRSTEEIPLVVVLQSTDYINLKNIADVYVNIKNCDGNSSPNCVTQTTKYKPTGLIYDDKTNTNFYFFRYLWLLDNGSLLSDSNFLGFNAVVTDKTGVRTAITPVLADPCLNNQIDVNQFYSSNFLGYSINLGANVLGLDLPETINLGCLTGQDQEAIVSTTTNSTQQTYLDIDNSISPTTPQLNFLICIPQDLNNFSVTTLDDDITCFMGYKLGERPIDSFRLRITNSNSDLSNESSDRQYKEFNINYELIALNDLQSLKKQLELNNGSIVIESIGDFVWYYANEVASPITSSFLSTYNKNSFLNKGLITGLGADTNFDQPLTPNTISGIMVMTIHGIPTINKNDFRNDSRYQNFNRIDTTDFIAVSRELDVELPDPTSSITLEPMFNRKITIEDPIGLLVIDELPSKKKNSTSNPANDQNANSPFASYPYFPTTLAFTFNLAMYYDNQSGSQQLSVVYNFATTILDNFVNGVIDFLKNVGSTQNTSQSPFDLFAQGIKDNFIWICIALAFLYLLTVLYSNVNNGGSTVAIPRTGGN